ncbi:MAG: inositol monophosphatase [bacterium]|nr:inositol monophosphatase [bacterium]
MQLLNTAIRAAQKGGEVVARYYETGVAREVKDDKSFVTRADKEAEEAIITEIKSQFPDHGFLGEESGKTMGASEYTWVIDPLDGTSNFVNGIPIFGVSVAVLQQGSPVAAAVYQPVGNTLYSAEKGKGTYWNGKPVRVSNGDAQHAMISFGPGKKEKERLNRIFSRVESYVKTKRYLGSAALELAFLARGGTEGFICLGLNSWDYAAGVLIVEEAGGLITHLDGTPWKFGDGDSFIASNGKIHDKLVSLVASVKG